MLFLLRIPSTYLLLRNKAARIVKAAGNIKKLNTSSQQNNIKLTKVHNVMLEYMIELINYTIYK